MPCPDCQPKPTLRSAVDTFAAEQLKSGIDFYEEASNAGLRDLLNTMRGCGFFESSTQVLNDVDRMLESLQSTRERLATHLAAWEQGAVAVTP
jgi:hypothetical protein